MSNKSARQKIMRKFKLLTPELLTCKPLDSYDEILKFLENPPPWRTLCEELKPHSNESVNNMDNLTGYQVSEIMLGTVLDYCHFDPDGAAADPTRFNGEETKSKPKTLVCHDMANGYHDDSHIDGTVNYDSYTFYNWAGIDIFCYFSHHLITIPPLGWINVGHAHGVKVIGTIITEWAEGVVFWDKVLESENNYTQFASAVVAIAKTLKFDGWLLNIENKISKPDVLLKFVSHLHKLLHSELVNPVLIWYDSVTISGKLSWQNKLNEKNKAFFDICDGFFTNYSWSVADIETSVIEAGDRVTDLYIGIDIWGRNFYCGGQFNSYEAIKAAYNEGCSLAIFAPAWTHEAMTIDPTDVNFVHKADGLTKFTIWRLRDRALWFSIWPYLRTRLPNQLPFQTSFCTGQGKKRWLYGEVVSPGPWYNLRLQQYQPNAAVNQHGYTLTIYDEAKKHLTRTHKEGKGIMKDPGHIQTQEEVPSIADGQLRESVQFDQDIVTEVGASGPIEEIEHIKSTKREARTPVSSEIVVHKSRLQKSVIQRFLDLFKCKSTPNQEIEKDKYYKNEQIVSHSTAGTSAMVPTGSVRKTVNKYLQSSPGRSLDGSGPSWPVQSPHTSYSPEETRPLVEQHYQERRLSTKNSLDKLVKNDESVISLNTENLISTHSTRTSLITTSIYLNLRQPDIKTRWELTYIDSERECLELYLNDAFNGGACLRINPSDLVNSWHRMTRLFHCDFKCDNMLIVCVVTKPTKQYVDQYLNVRLKMKNAAGQDLQVVLLGRHLDMPTVLSSGSVGIHYAYPLHAEDQQEFLTLREYLLLNEPGFYVPIDNFYGWEVRYYKVKVPGSRVIQINCRTELPHGSILLGHLGICHSDQN